MSSGLAPIFDLLTAKAFTPDPLDPGFTLKSRLSRQKSILVLTIGGMGVVGHRARLKGGGWEIATTEKIEGPYLTPVLLDQGRDLAQSDSIIISFTPANLLCELESGRMPDDNALQKAMLTNPRSILRNRYEQDRRYQLLSSADHKKFISFSVTSRDATAIERMIKDAGMEICRFQIGLANIAEHVIRRVETARRDGATRMILVGDQSMILSMAVRDGTWDEPFSFISRTSGNNSGTNDSASVVEYLESLASELPDGGAEFYLLHGGQCWWLETAQEWFSTHSERFTLVTLDDAEPWMDMHLALEN